MVSHPPSNASSVASKASASNDKRRGDLLCDAQNRYEQTLAQNAADEQEILQKLEEIRENKRIEQLLHANYVKGIEAIYRANQDLIDNLENTRNEDVTLGNNGLESNSVHGDRTHLWIQNGHVAQSGNSVTGAGVEIGPALVSVSMFGDGRMAADEAGVAPVIPALSGASLPFGDGCVAADEAGAAPVVPALSGASLPFGDLVTAPTQLACFVMA